MDCSSTIRSSREVPLAGSVGRPPLLQVSLQSRRLSRDSVPRSPASQPRVCVAAVFIEFMASANTVRTSWIIYSVRQQRSKIEASPYRCYDCMLMAARIPSLDGLRAVSIAFVVLAHLAGTRGFPFDVDAVHSYGNFGVRIFFVISGFLITSILLHEYDQTGHVSLTNFYERRAYRILPAAYVFLIVGAVAYRSSLRWQDIIAAFAYFNNFTRERPWIFGHLWSLCVEEQFYLIWPFLFSFFPGWRIHIAIATILMGPLVRVFFWTAGMKWLVPYSFPSVADALATGCLLALLQPLLANYDRVFAKRWFFAVPIATSLLPLLESHFNWFYHSAGLTMVHIGIALSIHLAVRRRFWFFNLKPITWVGVMSYSLYLWQEPFLNRNSDSVWTSFPLNLALVFACGAASHYFVERPFLHLRETRATMRRADSSRNRNSIQDSSSVLPPNWRASKRKHES